jgi:hypothetical protein
MLTFWIRFDLEGKLSNMMKNLTALPGAPESRTVARGLADDGLFPLLVRKSDVSELAPQLRGSG